VDQGERRISTTACADEGQTLIIQVRPANPKASLPAKRAFKVEVRLDSFGNQLSAGAWYPGRSPRACRDF
jgi:hypothetical protein